MNTKRYRLATWVGGIGAVGLVILLVVARSERQAERRPPGADVAAAVPPPASVAEPTAQIPAPAPLASQPTAVVEQVASLAAICLPPSSASLTGVVRVNPGKVLATVNGVEITLKDLMPLPDAKTGTEQTLSAERYSFLLDRAIKREIALQAAREQGIELSARQRQQLEQLRARSEQTEPGVFDTVQQNPANTEFAVRDATGLLLQAALAEKAGVPSPHVTPALVQSYYQQHEAAYGALPADPVQRGVAWERIDRDIRLKLASLVQAEHQVRLREFLNGLTASAQVAKPAS